MAANLKRPIKILMETLKLHAILDKYTLITS